MKQHSRSYSVNSTMSSEGRLMLRNTPSPSPSHPQHSIQTDAQSTDMNLPVSPTPNQTVPEFTIGRNDSGSHDIPIIRYTSEEGNNSPHHRSDSNTSKDSLTDSQKLQTSILSHLSTILLSEEEGQVVGSAQVVCQCVREFVNSLKEEHKSQLLPELVGNDPLMQRVRNRTHACTCTCMFVRVWLYLFLN